MIKEDHSIDTAAMAVVNVRKTNDLAAEASALLALGQALLMTNRKSEGRYICRQAERLAFQVGDRGTQGQALTALGMNLEELERRNKDDRWREWYLSGREETAPYRTFESARADEFYKAGSQRGIHYFGAERLLLDLAVGYVVCKFLGSFTEAFAAKLGERLGESTASAIGRIRLLLDRGNNHNELDIVMRGRTTLILPENFTDEAKLAAIELDVTADGIHGAVLHWDSVTGQWKSDSPEQTIQQDGAGNQRRTSPA